jgi:hypothetical protein
MKKLDTTKYKVFVIVCILCMCVVLTYIIDLYNLEIQYNITKYSDYLNMKNLYYILIIVIIVIILILSGSLIYIEINSDNMVAQKAGYKKGDYIVFSESESQGMLSGNVLKYYTGPVSHTKNEDVYIQLGAGLAIKKYKDIYKNFKKNKVAADKKMNDLNGKEKKKENKKKDKKDKK